MTRSTFLRSAVLLAGLGLAAPGLAAGAAQAQPMQEKREMVRYADLDVHGPAGVRALLSRIRAASGRVCDEYASPLELTLNAEVRECMKRSQGEAVRALDMPWVTAAFEGRPGPAGATYAQASPAAGPAGRP